jgi:hypothetical protein
MSIKVIIHIESDMFASSLSDSVCSLVVLALLSQTLILIILSQSILFIFSPFFHISLLFLLLLTFFINRLVFILILS